MALHLVLCRSHSYEPKPTAPRFKNISRISCYSESEEWSTMNLYPQFPKNINFGGYKIICSVNIFLCLRFEEEYVLWNQSNNTFRLIPHPDLGYLPCSCSSRQDVDPYLMKSSCGLGFVAESQDYKFVRFMMYGHGTYHHNDSYHVAVYSYKTNSWKELPFPFDRAKEYMYPSEDRADIIATYVNGFCYWNTLRDFIISFEFSSDKFSTLPYPDDLAWEEFEFSDKHDEFLLELDGSLGLVIQLQLESEKETAKLFSFWAYDSSSISISSSPWTRKFNLDVRLAAKKPLWLGKKKNNSLVLLLEGFDGALLEYNYSRRELNKIDQIDDHRPCRMMMISPYVETNINGNIDNGDGADRISQLPDDVILCILSFLSLKEAASTSVLSTRWSDLWRHIPNLVFPNIDLVMLMDKCKYTKCVNSVVESHKALSSKEFNISFPLNYSTRRSITKWLEFAFSKGVEVLVLNLVGKRFTLLEKKFQRKSSIFKSSNLMSLCLKCLEVSGEAIGLFLRNCPLLERLTIKYALLTSDLEVCGGVLKHLDIQYSRGRGQGRGRKSIKGYAPNLTYLRINSSRKLVWDYSKSFISSPFKTLEFTLHCPESILKKGFPQMTTLRELIVTYYGSGHAVTRPITYLLRALPYLEEFELKQQHHYSFFKKQGMEVVNNVIRFCHRHLRVFKFTWFDVGDDDHIELMNYILDNCIALQKIVLQKYAVDRPSHATFLEYVKQLQSKLPSHVQLITR